TRGKYDNWSDFSKDRMEKYSSSGFGPNMPKKAIELRQKLTETKRFKGIEDPKTTLGEALDQLSKVHDVTFDVNEKAFKFENLVDPLKAEIAATPIPEFTGTMSLMLKKMLTRVPVASGATYIIRRGVIEITTEKFAVA